MTPAEPAPEVSEERWTIWVCRGCGEISTISRVFGCRCGTEEPSPRTLRGVERVEVGPAEQIEVLRRERDEATFALAEESARTREVIDQWHDGQARLSEVEQERDACGKLAGDRLDLLRAAEREAEQLREALELAAGAIRYAREPHHLSHEEECSICHTAAGHLDAALETARSALDRSSTPSQDQEASDG